MSHRLPAWLVVSGAAALVFALLNLVLSAVESTGIVVGILLVGANAWLSPRAVRIVGAAFLAALLVVVVRGLWSTIPALTIGVLAAVTAGRYAPTAVLRRVAFMVPSLVLLVFVTTLLMYYAPGNPFVQERATSPQVEAALRAHFGVPDNAVDFFLVYMKRLLLESSFGPSLKVHGRTVEALLAPAFPVSMALGLAALTLAVAIGLVLGVRAGLAPNSASDHSSMALALVGISLPNFVIGAALIIVFSLHLRWFPVAGWGSYQHLVLPAITLALPYAAYVARLARNGTIEIMQEDFIRTARAKGLPERIIVLRHALKGAIMPVVSYLGPAAAGILTGSFVVETLFNIPGMGQWFVKGAINRDYSLVLATAIIYTTLVTAFNLVVDLAYAWLDPRARGSL